MAKDFYTRLNSYFIKIAKVLRGEADAASIFPNSSDIGTSREEIYLKFLKAHAPSKCNIFLGGFLFHADGRESKQLDVIITTDTAPQFNFYNPNGNGKSFSPVEGALGVASIKSKLDKAQLHDALDGISSIPPTESLDKRIPITVQITQYDDWPYKIIYAHDGINGETILEHISNYYETNSHISADRRPNLIHVAGKFLILRIIDGMEASPNEFINYKRKGDFILIKSKADLHAILLVVDNLQQHALASSNILYSYEGLVKKTLEVNSSE